MVWGTMMGMMGNDLHDGVVVVWGFGFRVATISLRRALRFLRSPSPGRSRTAPTICVSPPVSGRVFMATFGVAPPPAPFQGRRAVIVFLVSVTSPFDATWEVGSWGP